MYIYNIYIYIYIYILCIIYIHIIYNIYSYICIYIYNLLVNLYMQLTISSCYGLIRLTLGLKGGDGGLSSQCHTCRFTCQQRVLKVKTFLF